MNDKKHVIKRLITKVMCGLIFIFVKHELKEKEIYGKCVF